MYSVYKLKKWDVVRLLKVSDILYKCGKDMAEKYELHHWNNSYAKNWIIILLCALKNDIYVVYDKKVIIATFQIKKVNNSLLFQKLATLPEFSGGGIGSFCLNEIERLARCKKCNEIICEVFDKSEHAKSFYEHRGYVVYGTTETLKYTELKLKKKL